MFHIKEIPFTAKYPVLYVIRDNNNKSLGSSIDKSKTEKVLSFLIANNITSVDEIKNMSFTYRKKLIYAGFDGFI
jgi:hypothetical protein